MLTKLRVPTEEEVRTKAYEIYLQHGERPGHDVDDWLQAEYELMQLPVHKLAALEPPQLKTSRKLALVALIQAAVLLGAEMLPHIRR